MRLNKIISIFIVLILLFSVTSCNSTDTASDITSGISQTENNSSDNKTDKEKENQSTPLLYKASDKKGNYIWLFGSIHVGEDYFYPLPEYVISAFNEADSLAVEFDITTYERDFKAQMKSLQAFVYTDGTKIKDHIPEKTYEKAKKILKDNNFYNASMDYYFPAFWSSIIENITYEKIKIDYDLGIDRHLIKKAHDTNKKIHDIESAELQYNMMAGFSEDLQIMILESSILSYKLSFVTKYQIKNMMKEWAKGDEEKLASQVSAEGSILMNKEEKALYAEYNQKIVTERNISMTDWAEKALKSGENVFICVGAAHIVGDGAMAQLLTERGYTVEKVN